MVRFAAFTGLRAGEIVALRVRRLDLMRRRVEVAESASETHGQLQFGAPKTYERRAVPIPVGLAQQLAEHVARKQPDDFVFFSSIVLGDADRALRVVKGLSRGTDVMDNVIWWDLAQPMRQTAGFRRLVGAVGLEQLWRARGWPDKCRPKGAGDFVCD